ncbi:hypothetical protein GCM10009660_17960 [Catellatospora bangladeshensis]
MIFSAEAFQSFLRSAKLEPRAWQARIGTGHVTPDPDLPSSATSRPAVTVRVVRHDRMRGALQAHPRTSAQLTRATDEGRPRHVLTGTGTPQESAIRTKLGFPGSGLIFRWVGFGVAHSAGLPTPDRRNTSADAHQQPDPNAETAEQALLAKYLRHCEQLRCDQDRKAVQQTDGPPVVDFKFTTVREK